MLDDIATLSRTVFERFGIDPAAEPGSAWWVRPSRVAANLRLYSQFDLTKRRHDPALRNAVAAFMMAWPQRVELHVEGDRIRPFLRLVVPQTEGVVAAAEPMVDWPRPHGCRRLRNGGISPAILLATETGILP